MNRLPDEYLDAVILLNEPEALQRLIDEVQALRSASGWLPIESAPKDGTYVMLWWPYWSDHAMDGCWDDRGYWIGCRSLAERADGPQPTHWMPLPAAPPVSAREAGGAGQ